MKLVKHGTYAMYYLEWPDGVRSRDFYSKPWATEHIRRIQDVESRTARR